MANPGGLERFVAAQDASATYDRALEELRGGHKRTHWMWFVFPQLEGLGRSATAQRYALRGLEEAQAYLAHPVLAPRLRACVAALLDGGQSDPVAVLGPVDAQKLRSSMTLFEHAAPADPRFGRVLEVFFDGQRDAVTAELLARAQ